MGFRSVLVVVASMIPVLELTRWGCVGWLIAAMTTMGVVHSDEPRVEPREMELERLAGSARRILEQHCFACHSREKSESGLRVDSRLTLLQGGDRGAAIEPEHRLDSLLLRTIDGSMDELQMPPKKSLQADEIALLKLWIEADLPWWSDRSQDDQAVKPMGDAWSDPQNPIRQKFGRERLQLWSLRPILRPKLPRVVKADWAFNPVDTFLLADWEARGLQPAPDAAPTALQRRASFDIIGLPPFDVGSIESNRIQVRDAAIPDDFVAFIDELLSSYLHGQHLARMWLDVVRYSDSNGFDWDEFRPNAWRYRDYVVRAFNADMPYDQFLMQQIAGDELFEGNPKTSSEMEAWLATGYLRLGPHDNAAPLFNEQSRSRHELLSDLTETTASAFLGLTLSCCRCHDHKTEPLTQQDHYRFRAFFSQVAFADDRPLLLETELQELNQHNEPIDLRIAEIDAKVKSPTDGTPLSSDEVKVLQSERKELEKRRRMPPTGLLMRANRDSPEPTRVFFQGDHREPREEVEPGFPSLFEPNPAIMAASSSESPAGPRTILSRWMLKDDNPWTARVIVNRLWLNYFDDGLVSTPNDFGLSGQPPKYPLLLDWLASELIRSNWSIRHIERLIVTSHAYRMVAVPDIDRSKDLRSETNDLPSRSQSGHVREDSQMVRTVSLRSKLRRLTAEQLRDAVLCASGLLQQRAGGPPVWPELPEDVLQANPAFLDDNETKTKGWYPSPESLQTVRSLFLVQKRTVRIPFLETFDLPENSTSCPRRDASIVAPQALSLLNSDLMTQAARSMANESRRVESELDLQVDRLFRMALGRPAALNERLSAIELVQQHSLEALARALINTNEFVFVE